MEDCGSRKKQKVGEDTIWGSLRTRTLDNGFKQYTVKNELPLGTGFVTLVVKVGYLCEDKDEVGISHLLEHVLVRAIVEAKESPFARQMSTHRNHETCPNYTVFKFEIDRETDFVEAIRLCELIANQEVKITDKQVEIESKIVNMEYLTVASDSEYFLPHLVKIGSTKECLSNLGKINLDQLTKFYKKWYIPSHMALFVTGNFNDKELLTKQKCFGETSARDCIPDIPDFSSPSWTLETINLNDPQSLNALIFKIKRSSSLLDNLGMKISMNAANRRSKESGSLAYIIDKGLNVFIVFANYLEVEQAVYEFLRLSEWGLTSSEIEREFNLIKREMTKKANWCHLDGHYQIDVLQEKLLNLFLYDDPFTSLDSEIKMVEDFKSLQDLVRRFLGLLTINEARIYVKEFTSNSAQSLIKEVKEKGMTRWKEKTFVDYDGRTCQNQDPVLINYFKEVDMHEFRLSNEMRVLLCRSAIPPFECNMKGFAFGGLSEKGEDDYISSYFGLKIVEQLPSFPLRIDLR